MNPEKKRSNEKELLLPYLEFSNKSLVDVGCGSGDLVSWAQATGLKVTGIDVAEMVENAKRKNPDCSHLYITGTAQDIPLESLSADYVVLMASFHHVHECFMHKACAEIYRILKPQGKLIFLEPVAREGSYTDLLKIACDEEEIQKTAYRAIKSMPRAFEIKEIAEEYYFFERTYNDYQNLIQTFFPEKEQQELILKKADRLVESISAIRNTDIDKLIFHSHCRLNVFQKS